MLTLGIYHRLTVVRESEQGFYLTKDEEDAVLLPNRYIPEGLQIGDEIDVFLYSDSQGRPIATTLTPRLTLHEFAALEVTSVTKYGAFMDWGIAKELLVPFREQNRKLEEGDIVVIYLFYDEVSSRLVGSAKVRKFLSAEQPDVKEGEEVEILVYDQSDLGYKVIINNLYEGMIYENEMYSTLQIGDRSHAYVRKIRDDNKIDLQLQPLGYAKIASNSEKILQFLKENNGWLPLTDKSSPSEIKQILSMSKKTFKQAVGDLYKKQFIDLKEDGISLR
jgi:predicted RNA-binding protein (virulence factor B family)